MKHKTHMRSIRLRNNAGIDFPVCYSRAKLLDLDKSALPTTGEASECTCKRCMAACLKYDGWAYSAKDFVSFS